MKRSPLSAGKSCAAVILLLAVASCATTPPEGGTDAEGPPPLADPGPPILSSETLPGDYLVYRGVGLVPPAGVGIVPGSGGEGEALLRFEGSDLVGEIHVLDAEADDLFAFLADQSLSGDVVEGSYGGNDGIDWQLLTGRRTNEEGAWTEAHAVAHLEGLGSLHLLAVGSDGGTAAFIAELLPTILLYPEDRNARWRGYTGFAAFSQDMRWVADVDGEGTRGVIFQAIDAGAGEVRSLWVLQGEAAAEVELLRTLLGSGEVELGEPVTPGLRLGAPVDPRGAETRRLLTPEGAGLSALWRRPSGEAVSILLLPASAGASPLPTEEAVAWFNREIQPVLFLGEAP